MDSDTSLRVGDTDGNAQARGFCAIDLSDLPAGAQVESAMLRLHYGSKVEYPWRDLGTCVLDHVDLGAALDPGDFARPPLTSAFTNVPHVPVAQEHDLDITGVVRADVAAGR